MAKIYQRLIEKCWDCPYFLAGLVDKDSKPSTSDKCLFVNKEISFIDPSKEIAPFCELENV